LISLQTRKKEKNLRKKEKKLLSIKKPVCYFWSAVFIDLNPAAI
jgi:hypothetical protein